MKIGNDFKPLSLTMRIFILDTRQGLNTTLMQQKTIRLYDKKCP